MYDEEAHGSRNQMLGNFNSFPQQINMNNNTPNSDFDRRQTIYRTKQDFGFRNVAYNFPDDISNIITDADEHAGQ